jgi:integrative and conjugative element protein (TIGR02256 family)
MEIRAWTAPGPDDVASHTSFIKRDMRHQFAAMSAWRTSFGTHTYVGEWHSHPSGAVVPSLIDRSTWRKVTRRNRARCVFMLVSPAGWGLFLVTAGIPQRILRLAKIEDGQTGSVFG